MSNGMDIASLLGSLGSPQGGMEEPMESPAQDNTEDTSVSALLTAALKKIRQATDSETDPAEKASLEQISTMIQKWLAKEHSDTLGTMGMKPAAFRTLSKAGSAMGGQGY